MHSRVKWWTDQSIAWYERASSSSAYHNELSGLIAPYLEKGLSIVEAGCGLGYETEILSKMGYDIRGLDSDPSVIEHARGRSGLGIFDCRDFGSFDGEPDILLCINFGHMESPRQLAKLLSVPRRRLVYVISRHSGHGTKTRADRSALIGEMLDHMSREGGIRYERRDFKLRFDQPLLSLSEAEAFMDWTYLGDDLGRYMEYVHPSDGQFPYIFRNEKSMVLFSIDSRRLQ